MAFLSASVFLFISISGFYSASGLVKKGSAESLQQGIPDSCPRFSQKRLKKTKALRSMCSMKKEGGLPWIGATLDYKSLVNIPGYGDTHAYHYNLMTTDAGECQWGNYEKNSTPCEYVLDYAEKNKIAFRYHSLIWPLHGYPMEWVDQGLIPDTVRPAKGKGTGGPGGARWYADMPDEDLNISSRFESRGRDLTQVYPQSLMAAYQRKTLTVAEKKKRLVEHVKKTVEIHKGRVHSYDVINEAVCSFGAFNRKYKWWSYSSEQKNRLCFFSKYYNAWLKKSLWAEGAKTDLEDFMDLAFKTARAADPKVKLCYNDYVWESNNEPFAEKNNNVLNLLKGFQTRGVPVGCAGFQMHIDLSYIDFKETWIKGLESNMRAVADLGLDIMITEFEAKCSDMHQDLPCNWDKRHSLIQANLYRQVLHTCIGNPRCISFESFGWNDAISFANTPNVMRHPYPFDECSEPKDAYWAISKELQGVTKL